jgi:hypothetical protein
LYIDIFESVTFLHSFKETNRDFACGRHRKLLRFLIELMLSSFG